MKTTSEHYLERCTDAIQFMDELGGPESAEYVDVMTRLAADCAERAQIAFESHIKGEIYTDERHGGRFIIDHMRDGRVCFFAQGGGFQHAVSLADFAQHFKPAPALRFALGRVTGEWLTAEYVGGNDDVAFPAYLDGRKWNGWSMPYFTKETAADMLTASGNTWRFDEASDAFIVADEQSDDGEVSYVGETIDVGSERVHVYGVGAGCWTWDTV